MRLLEDLDDARAALELGLGGLVELGAELRERLQLPILGEIETKTAGDGLHRLDLSVAAHTRHRDAHVDGRPDSGEEEAALEIDLSVGDRDDVRRDVGRDVTALGLDDRKRSQRAPAVVVGELRRPLQQPGVQVEDVSRIRFPARGPAKQQRKLPVGDGLLGEVVVDDQRMFALLHPVLAHRTPRVGGDVLVRGGVRRRGVDHDGVLERSVLLERVDHLRDRRRLLPDGDVDALHLLVGAPQLTLVDDGVDDDGSLARLAVADDELALPAPDRRHRVDGFDARLERLFDGLTRGHRRRLYLERTALLGVDGPLSVHRIAESVDDASQQGVSDRRREDLPRLLDRIAFFDLRRVAEYHHAELVFLEVHGEARDTAPELEHLVGHRSRQPADARDPVADLRDAADFFSLDLRLVFLDVASQYRGDRLPVDR